MEPIQIIIIISAIILSFMALKLVTKILFRLIIILITIIIFFMGYQHFSGTNTIDYSAKFCQKNGDPIKCDCFYNPIYNNLRMKFSEEEIQLLKKNKLKSNIEFGKSFQATEKEIRNCFEEFGQTTLFKEIFNDIKLKDIFYSNTLEDNN